MSQQPPTGSSLSYSAYSIRKSLQGELADFLAASGFQSCTPTAELVRDLTSLLATYKEEGESLYPVVFLLSSQAQFAELAPGTAFVEIGSRDIHSPAAAAILKDCAPLAQNGWSVFIIKDEGGTHFRYGVFRALAHTFATGAEETLVTEGSSASALVLRSRGHLIVELQNATRGIFTASLTTSPATESSFARDVATLADAMSASLSEPARERFAPYLRRFLAALFQQCHGTLCAVHVRPQDNQPPEGFSKSVWLNPPLAWVDAFEEARTQKTADSLALLQSVESLVTGMVGSDGVVVFSTEGQVLGYRAFLSPRDEERKFQTADGGGRRRTYELMLARLGDAFAAAFFRSQDGATACKRAQ